MSNVNRKKRHTIYYIYKITFLCGEPEGRYYIGKRTCFRDCAENDNYTGSGLFCFAYFKKYGKIYGQTYTKEILEINTSQELNKNREEYGVGTKYKDDPLCMNLYHGGCGSASHEVNCYVQDQYKKDINQYSLDGTFIKTGHGIRNVARELGLNRSGIVACLSGRKPSAFGFIGKYYEGNTDNIDSHRSINPVVQYNKNGKIVKEFKSPGEASNFTGIHSGSILEVCKGNRLTAGTYVWRFKNEPFDKYRTNQIKQPSPKKGLHQNRPILQLDMDGNILRKGPNVYEAALNVGIKCSCTIYCVANGTRKSAGGFKGRFEE